MNGLHNPSPPCECGKPVNSPSLVTAEDITEGFVEWFYDSAIDGWYDDGPVDWEEVIDRAEDYEHDFGDSMLSPAILKIQRECRRIRREAGIS